MALIPGLADHGQYKKQNLMNSNQNYIGAEYKMNLLNLQVWV